MINNTYLFSPVPNPTKVRSLHSGRTACLGNSKGIMEVTVGHGLRKVQLRMSADGSGKIYIARGHRGSVRPAGFAHLVRVGRRPVAEKIWIRYNRKALGGDRVTRSASDALEGKGRVSVNQKSEMKGKECSGDLGGWEAKSGLTLSRRCISKDNTLRPMRPVRLTHLTPER